MRPPGGIRALFRTRGIGYAAALAAVAVVSGFISLVELRIRIENISMLYLIAVLATATAFGSGPAILAALAAFLTFNWFFVEPVHTFIVADPEEWVSLLLFLLTAVVTGQLAAGQRRQAQQAQQREREALVLYDVVRLMGEADLDRALSAVAQRLRAELGLAGVVIEVADGAVTARAAAGEPEALQRCRSTTAAPVQLLSEMAPAATQRSESGRWIRIVPPRPAGEVRMPPRDGLQVVPVQAQDRRVGGLLLVRAPTAPEFSAGDDRLLRAVAAQLGPAVERIRLRREATEAEILRRSDELKTALLQAVSHDLRTPLATIVASAGSLRQQEVAWTDRDRQELAEAIEQEARRLNRIVGNLLDLSRIEGGILRPEKGWYDLGALVDDVLGRLRPMTSGHNLIVDVPDDLPPVYLDFVQIDQVLTNLIENATKYTPPGSKVRLSVHRTEGEIRVEVADRGPGLAPEALPHLFEPFYRAEGRRARQKGTGLGLAVARGLVEAHGGRIWAENRREGGARFLFALPLALVPGSPVAEGSP